VTIHINQTLGVGHKDCAGGFGGHNAFGDAFEDAGNKWTEDLCRQDSDGGKLACPLLSDCTRGLHSSTFSAQPEPF
jgi:hypothetical protein